MTEELTRSLVLEAPEVLQVLEVPLPTPGPGEVRLRTLACGVCGSDLRYYVGDNPWAQHTLGRQAPVDWGRTILGHEVCAVIEAVGPGVDASRVGETVGVIAMQPCGVCPDCRAGNANLCHDVSHLGHGGGWPADYDRKFFPGAMSDRFLYFATACVPLPADTEATPDEFALADMVAVAVHAFGRANRVCSRGVGKGDRALVIGCGQVGLSIAQVAAHAHGVDVTGIDPAEIVHQVAQAVGIPVTTDLGALPLDAPFDAIFDTVCTPETLAQGLKRLAPGGAYVLLAPHEMTYGIPPLAVGGERAITTSCNFAPPGDFAEALRLIASRVTDMRPYITRSVALSDAPAAFHDLHERRDSQFKVVITPGS
jgi:threonine dehydrogenase-like Zn-dependent dehydrogenase